MNGKPLPEGPTHGAVVLFIIAISVTVLLVAGGAIAAIYTATHHADTATSQLQSVIDSQHALIVKQEKELHASCDFWGTLAGIPITTVPPATKPSKLGVSIIVRSRVAYEGQGCRKLPPADPSVRKWAAYYHLPLQ
jgi:hypothetical protein